MGLKKAIGIHLVATLLLGSGCSLKQLAVNQLGDALSGGGDVFASDNDPELVGDALPFSLKLMESILAESPQHEGLLTSLASGFTQYAYGWVQLEADQLESSDFGRAVELRERAQKLYLRAAGYGWRGLESRYPGIEEALKTETERALARLKPRDVELVYWTALPWAAAISISLDDMDLVGDLAYVEAMMERAMELDPDWSGGAVHSFFITYEMGRMTGSGDPVENATGHYQRALELSQGREASVHVAFAEAVAVAEQDREVFVATLEKALQIDVDAYPSLRVNNLLYQKRARWLLENIDELFL